MRRYLSFLILLALSTGCQKGTSMNPTADNPRPTGGTELSPSVSGAAPVAGATPTAPSPPEEANGASAEIPTPPSPPPWANFWALKENNEDPEYRPPTPPGVDKDGYRTDVVIVPYDPCREKPCSRDAQASETEEDFKYSLPPQKR